MWICKFPAKPFCMFTVDSCLIFRIWPCGPQNHQALQLLQPLEWLLLGFPFVFLSDLQLPAQKQEFLSLLCQLHPGLFPSPQIYACESYWETRSLLEQESDKTEKSTTLHGHQLIESESLMRQCFFCSVKTSKPSDAIHFKNCALRNLQEIYIQYIYLYKCTYKI